MVQFNHQQFWFSAFRSVISTLAQLPGIPVDEMAAADWARLSELLPDGYTDAHIRELVVLPRPGIPRHYEAPAWFPLSAGG
jgi:hypothetical protein